MYSLREEIMKEDWRTIEVEWDIKLDPEAYRKVYNPPKKKAKFTPNQRTFIFLVRRQSFSKSGFIGAVAKKRIGK